MIICGGTYRRIEDLNVGDHACFIFKREEDWLAIVIPYILTGLARGERVCFIADSLNPEQILSQLKQKNPDADTCLKKGQLIIISRGQCAKKNKLDAGGTFSFIQEETEAALAEGYSALRIISAMNWGRNLQNFEMQQEELAKANDFILHNKCLSLCLFDQRHIHPEALQSLLYIFPLVIIDTEIYDNYYYLAPEALLSPDQPELKLNLMMDLLKEKRQFLQVLQESEAKFKGIYESSPIGIEIYGQDGKLIHVNKACIDIFGVLNIEDVYGFNLFNDPNRPEDAKSSLLRGETVRYETTFDFEKIKDLGLHKTLKSGIAYIYVIISPLFLEEYKIPSNYLVQVQDITERKASEERLIASESKFSAAFQINPDPLAITDISSGKIIDINRSYEEVTGFSKAELIGHSTEELNIWVNPSERDDILRLLYDRREVRDRAIRLRMKDGLIREMLFSARFITISDQCYLLSQAHDITEEKAAEENLKRDSEHLEALIAERTEHLKNFERMATIGETAAMIGHDLRNPLQVLLCMVYLARERLNSGRINSGRLSSEGPKLSFDEILTSIEESADYMNKIISDVQDYARPMKLDLVETEISYFLREALFTIIISDNVRIDIQIEDNMPRVLIDQEKMKRVIINLISDSLNAMPEGGLIEISVIHIKDRIKISIKDTGTGIPKENMPHIFKPLFTTRSKGAGLGLSVCKRMVDAMGGNIYIKSEVGKGTEASVEIPTEQKDG